MPRPTILYALARDADVSWICSHASFSVPFGSEDLVALAREKDKRIAYGRLRALNPDALCLDSLQVSALSSFETVPALISFLFRQAQPQFKALYGLPTEYLRDDGLALPSTALFRQGRFRLAAWDLERRLNSTSDPALSLLLARCYSLMGIPFKALDAIKHALYGQADSPDALLALADWKAIHGDMASCADCYQQAGALVSLSIQAHVNLEYALRALGRFSEAAAETEWQLQRLPVDQDYYPHGWLQPRWRGEALQGGRLHVHWVDGYGDMILNARYLPHAAAKAGCISVECPSALLRLFLSSFPSIPFFPSAPECPRGYQSHISLIALPALLGDECHPHPPYLDVASLPEAPEGANGELCIGINRRASDYSVSRSFPAACLPLLVDMRLGRLTNLSPFLCNAERQLLQRCGIADAGSYTRDFFDAAQHIRAQDLVISVDTALAHLAAAMGKPTVLLLNAPAAPMWCNRVAVHQLYPTLIMLTKAASQSWHDFFCIHAETLHAEVARIQVRVFQSSFSLERKSS